MELHDVGFVGYFLDRGILEYNELFVWAVFTQFYLYQIIIANHIYRGLENQVSIFFYGIEWLKKESP